MAWKILNAFYFELKLMVSKRTIKVNMVSVHIFCIKAGFYRNFCRFII